MQSCFASSDVAKEWVHPGGGKRQVLKQALAILRLEGVPEMGDTLQGHMIPAQAAKCRENQAARGGRAAHLPKGALF